MHKRGTSLLEKQFIWGFYIVLAVIVYFIISSLVSQERYYEEYFVRDFGLTLDSAFNSPGDLEIQYSDIKDIKLNVNNKDINIGPLNGLSARYYSFTKDNNYELLNQKFDFSNDSFIIIKNKNKIYLNSKKNE